MATKTDTFRFGEEMNNRLSAWALLLKKDKTAIIREAFTQWEETQTEINKRKLNNILKELQ